MSSRFTLRNLPLALGAGLLGFSNDLTAQVTEWLFAKESVYEQINSSTPPTVPTSWIASAWIVTAAAGDAGLITISGGSISGSLPLQHDGNGDWYLEHHYETQAAMNAEFPSNATYTFTISGGSLGLVLQSFVVGPEQYPNTPSLTVASLATAQQFPSAAATTLDWNHPGPLTQTSGSTILGIDDRAGNEVYGSWLSGAVISATVPANTVQADACHLGWLAFTSDSTISTGGFGIAGTVIHASVLDFEIRSWPFPTAACARQATYGASCAGLDLQSSEPILGSNWTLSTFGIGGPTPFAWTYFSLAPLNPSLPLSALGLGVPGCWLHLDPASIVNNLGGLVPGGQLNITIPVPAAQNLGGMTIYAQTIALTSLTPLGLSSSNVVEAILGS
tara:strand:- start:51661 stop:52830 length:1170 start_codon:yes stop_codon:yes gene_type:complete